MRSRVWTGEVVEYLLFVGRLGVALTIAACVWVVYLGWKANRADRRQRRDDLVRMMRGGR